MALDAPVRAVVVGIVDAVTLADEPGATRQAIDFRAE